MNVPDVSVIVVTYNAGDWVRKCLASISGLREEKEYELIVVDNNSFEFDLAELQSWAPTSTNVLSLKSNIGFGGACNEGAKQASGRFLLFVNPDAILHPGSVSALVNFAESAPDVGIVGGKIYDPNGALDPRSCFGEITVWSQFCFAMGLSSIFAGSGFWNSEGMGNWGRDSRREVGTVTGCLMLVKRDVWQDLRGFDSTFFMYGEDVDLCSRARKRGWSSWFIPEAAVTHANGASSNVVDRAVMLHRGKATLALRSTSRAKGFLLLQLLMLGVALRASAWHLLKRPALETWHELWERRALWTGGWSAGLEDHGK